MHGKITVTFCINHNVITQLAHTIFEDCTRKAFAYIHSFCAVNFIGNKQRQARTGMFSVPLPCPSNHVEIIYVVMLRAIGTIPAHTHQRPNARHGDAPRGRNAVKVPVENAGNPVLMKQDEGVKHLLEPHIAEGLERLPRLGVVIIDKCNSVCWTALQKGVPENLPHIEPAVCIRHIAQAKMQRHVK